jgi:hypothetical protein
MTKRAIAAIVVTAFSTAVAPAVFAATPAECVAASESSLKLRDQRKLQAARAQALVCAASECPSVIQSECLRRVDQLNQAIPTIVFEAKDGAGSDLTNVKVAIDGQPLSDHLDGTELAVDPGEHRFLFEAAGTSVEKVIVVSQGEKARHERVVIGAAPAPVPPVAPAPVEAVAPAGSDSGKTLRWAGVGIGAAGLVGVVVGAVFGGIASSKASHSKDECSTPTNCPNHGQSVADYNTASTDATVSTVAFVAGGVAVAAGVVLYFVAPKAKAAGIEWQLVPAVGADRAGISLKGAF